MRVFAFGGLPNIVQYLRNIVDLMLVRLGIDDEHKCIMLLNLVIQII
jgi:hypothetical protein